jgi:L-iditol 2-dehydrogenase
VHYYKKFANGDLCACSPLSLGHESSGVVVALGPNVRNFSLGDRVALEVGIPCGDCLICRKGRYNLCKKMRFRSSAKSFPHFQGTLQERINHPAKWCYKSVPPLSPFLPHCAHTNPRRLPDSISFAAAALLEPLSVAIHSTTRASLLPGTTALVLGAGTVGLLVAAMARHSGCHTVTIADLSAPRVAYALAHGFATHGFVVPPASLSASASTSGVSTPASSLSSDGFATPIARYAEVQLQLQAARALAAELVAVTQPAAADDADEDVGVDYTFECTGVESCMQTALYATRPGGKVVVVGMGTPVQTLPLSAAQLREVDVVGVFRYANTYARAIEVVREAERERGKGRGFPDLEGMVTHRMKGLGEVVRGMEVACCTVDGEGGLVVKVVVET